MSPNLMDISHVCRRPLHHTPKVEPGRLELPPHGPKPRMLPLNTKARLLSLQLSSPVAPAFAWPWTGLEPALTRVKTSSLVLFAFHGRSLIITSMKRSDENAQFALRDYSRRRRSIGASPTKAPEKGLRHQSMRELSARVGGQVSLDEGIVTLITSDEFNQGNG